MTASLASVSSMEGDSWDLTSDPPVSRHTSRRSLSRNSNFADDESSDSSSSGYGGGYVIQGSFPSTDCMRVRWAIPVKSSDIKETSDGRRRVGIREVDGTMTCTIQEKSVGKGKSRGRSGVEDDEGIAMKLEYTGACKGIWFPGVATMLGMDVSLDVGNCEVTWAPGEERKWTVNGAAGFTGFAVGPPPTPVSKKPDGPQLVVLPATPNGRADNRAEEERKRWPSSSASLLRAPLPSHPDDSFSEGGSPGNTPLSSIASLTTIPSSPERRSRASSMNARTDNDPDEEIRSPKVPLSIHLNMNELMPPQKSAFTFSVTGTVLVTPPRKPFRLSSHPSSADYSGSDSDSDSEPVILPQFRVLFAEKETVATIVRNELDEASLDIYNSKGDISDPQSRKTVVQPNGRTQCGVDGGRIAIRDIVSPSSYAYRSRRNPSVDTGGRRTPSRPRTPNGLHRTLSAASLRQTFLQSPRKRADVVAIADVTADVRLNSPKGTAHPTSYNIELILPVPTDTGSEWLEFSLWRPLRVRERQTSLPQVQVTGAFVDTVPVPYESGTTVEPAEKQPALGFPLNDEAAPPEPTTWVKLLTGDAGGNLKVMYTVSLDGNSGGTLDVLLPTFAYPVAKMVVTIFSQKGMSFDHSHLQ